MLFKNIIIINKMSKHICEFCIKEFNTISSLNRHKVHAKYCLKIQNNIQDEKQFKCSYCDKILSSKQRLDSHKLSCKKLNENKEMENKIIMLESQLEIYKKISEDNHECIKDIAKQPKTYTQQIQNNNNRYLNLSPLNLTAEYVKDQVENNFTKNNFLEGQKGVAEFVFDNLLKDVNGKSKYICDDSSRHKYSYKTEDGQIMVDLRAKKLTDMIKNDIIKKSNDIISNEMKKTDDMLNYMGKILDINNMRTDDNGKFLSRLSILTQYTNEEIIDTVKEIIEKSNEIEYENEYIIEDDSGDERLSLQSNFERKLDERKKKREIVEENERKFHEELKKKYNSRKNL